jgi:signal transduction histidine kinase
METSVEAPSRPAEVRWTGVLTWLVATAPLVYGVAAGLTRSAASVAALGAAFAFGLGFAPHLQPRREGELGAGAPLQVVSAVAAVALAPFTMPGAPTLALLCVVAVPQFAFAGRDRAGLAVIGLQTAALAWVYRGDMVGPVGLALFVAALLGFQLFAFAAARLAAREARSRRELAMVVAELAASQAVLADGERLGERVRIARDLHDAVGHHLTTLALHLDLARRQDGDEARATVGTAHAICRLLLAELRDVVADVRATGGADLAAAIRALCARVPQLRIELESAPDLGPVDAEAAHELLRCVQEIVTNALRHARASSLRLRLSRDGQDLGLRAEDDGRGIAERRPGGGIDGLRERVGRLGGELRVGPRPDGTGTAIEVRVPAERRSP